MRREKASASEFILDFGLFLDRFLGFACAMMAASSRSAALVASESSRNAELREPKPAPQARAAVPRHGQGLSPQGLGPCLFTRRGPSDHLKTPQNPETTSSIACNEEVGWRLE